MMSGTEYGAENIFDLTTMEPYNLEVLYKSFSKISKEVVLYLPRTSDLNQIARYVPKGQKLEVAHYAMMGASKVCWVDKHIPYLLTHYRHCVCILVTLISRLKQKQLSHRMTKLTKLLRTCP